MRGAAAEDPAEPAQRVVLPAAILAAVPFYKHKGRALTPSLAHTRSNVTTHTVFTFTPQRLLLGANVSKPFFSHGAMKLNVRKHDQEQVKFGTLHFSTQAQVDTEP